jgi:hypothetical protein
MTTRACGLHRLFATALAAQLPGCSAADVAAHAGPTRRGGVDGWDGWMYPMAEDESGMRLVHDEQEPVLAPQLRKLLERRHVAVHAEQAVCHHDFTRTAGLVQKLLKVRYVVVPVYMLLAAFGTASRCQADPVDNRRMIQLVRKHSDISSSE